jgi:hypothetical protein
MFTRFLFYAKIPPGVLSSEMTSQSIRATEAVQWSQHPDGLGIQSLIDSYFRALGR